MEIQITMDYIQEEPSILESSISETISPLNQIKNKVLTEDLGKIFEMAICLLYEIDYDGKYKYSMDEAQKLKEQISQLREIYPHKLTHSAKNGSRYDFTGIEDSSIKLSAKTTKKDGKIAPQVIGQPSKKKFCEYFDIMNSSNLDEIKVYII
jgi:hypothetical protein